VARTKLATRMTIHVALVLVAALGVSGFLSIQNQRSTLLDEAHRNALWAADAVEDSLADAPMPLAIEDVRRLAQTAAKQPRVDRVTLIGPEGEVRVTSDGLGEGANVPLTDRACAGCHEGRDVPAAHLATEDRTILDRDRRILRAFAPVENETRCSTAKGCHDAGATVLGVVEVEAPLGPIDALVSDTIDSVLIVSAIATVVAAFLGGLALSRWLRPVVALVAGTRRIAEGDLEHQIDCNRTDELGTLCEAFNRMTSRLKETKLLLLRSEKLSSLGKLAAGVAHEINNPLMGILSFAEDLQDELPENDPRREDCDVIIREALRCRGIVRRLLDFARPEAPSFERVALNRVARQALALVSRQADFRNVRVDVLLEPELPPVGADANQLQQVVLNLIVNARDAVGTRGRISISTHSLTGGDRVELVVDDTGNGVPEELREKIFEPFFSTKKDRGTGIGLGVSRSIAEAHGGHLLVADAPSGGARFRLILPIYDLDESFKDTS
jgi:two-component system NtrC family sensor kinase